MGSIADRLAALLAEVEESDRRLAALAVGLYTLSAACLADPPNAPPTNTSVGTASILSGPGCTPQWPPRVPLCQTGY